MGSCKIIAKVACDTKISRIFRAANEGPTLEIINQSERNSKEGFNKIASIQSRHFPSLWPSQLSPTGKLVFPSIFTHTDTSNVNAGQLSPWALDYPQFKNKFGS